MEAAGTDLHRKRAVVVGGGLAGIAAAVRLSEAGVPVTLIETRKRLGGRATSFTDPQTGEELDNCQHVLTRGCTNLIDLYERLGVDEKIHWEKALYFADRTGRVDALEADDLPAPLHLLRPVLGMQTLSWREKWSILRGLSDIMQITPGVRRRLGDRSFGDWLRKHPQPAGAIEKFWSLIVTSACNEHPDNVAASYAVQVFQEGLLSHEEAYQMGVSRVPLGQLYEAAQRRLNQAGGELMLGAGVEQFIYRDGRVELVRLADRQEVAGEAFVSTVGYDRLAKLVDGPMVEADARLHHLAELEASPILGVHLFFEPADAHPLMTLPHLGLMQSPLHWIFNKGRGYPIDPEQVSGAEESVTPDEAPGRVRTCYLHGVISAAYDWVDKPANEIISMALREVRQALPAARKARLVHGRVVKEKRATFSIRPGVDRLRPSVSGPIENLYLAGDWVATGWPATMEGAVRSGYLAAGAILRQRGIEVEHDLAPGLEAGRVYRWLAG